MEQFCCLPKQSNILDMMNSLVCVGTPTQYRSSYTKGTSGNIQYTENRVILNTQPSCTRHLPLSPQQETGITSWDCSDLTLICGATLWHRQKRWTCDPYASTCLCFIKTIKLKRIHQRWYG